MASTREATAAVVPAEEGAANGRRDKGAVDGIRCVQEIEIAMCGKKTLQAGTSTLANESEEPKEDGGKVHAPRLSPSAADKIKRRLSPIGGASEPSTAAAGAEAGSASTHVGESRRQFTGTGTAIQPAALLPPVGLRRPKAE